MINWKWAGQQRAYVIVMKWRVLVESQSTWKIISLILVMMILRVRVFLACSIFILVVYSITAAHHDAFVYYFSLAIAKKIIIR